MTNAALAEAVGLTATPMLQRIKKLDQSGVIRKYMAVVDPALVGKPTLAFVHVTLRNHSMVFHSKFLSLVNDLPEGIECHHIAGQEDFLLKVAVRGMPEFEHFLLNRISTSGLIGRVNTTFILSSSKVSAPIPVGSTE